MEIIPNPIYQRRAIPETYEQWMWGTQPIHRYLFDKEFDGLNGILVDERLQFPS